MRGIQNNNEIAIYRLLFPFIVLFLLDPLLCCEPDLDPALLDDTQLSRFFCRNNLLGNLNQWFKLVRLTGA